MSKKIYFMAVNWEKINQDNSEDLEKGVWRIDINENNDVAHMINKFKYDEGWRVYAFTTKKARDELAGRTIK